MGIPKLIIGIFFSTIGLVSFATAQQSNPSHTALAYLLPFVTSTPSVKEAATLIPSRIPLPTGGVQVLSYKITVTPTQIPHETAAPTPIPTSRFVQPTPKPTTIVQTVNPSSDAKTFIMQAINDYRHANGLGSVTINDLTCNFATTRAQEISSNFSHDGFSTRLSSHTLPYPNYSLVTENIAETGNFKDVVNLWANSPTHAANMRADTPYLCVVQNGNYFAYEGWKPL